MQRLAAGDVDLDARREHSDLDGAQHLAQVDLPLHLLLLAHLTVRALLPPQLLAQRLTLLARRRRRALRQLLRGGGGDGTLLLPRRLRDRLPRLACAVLRELLGVREQHRLALALQQLRPEVGHLPPQGVELRAQRLRLLLPRRRAALLLLQARAQLLEVPLARGL
eukprot:scaffold84866_cov45-Phaeocystis_antarctica.AAC.2